MHFEDLRPQYRCQMFATSTQSVNAAKIMLTWHIRDGKEYNWTQEWKLPFCIFCDFLYNKDTSYEDAGNPKACDTFLRKHYGQNHAQILRKGQRLICMDCYMLLNWF